ncbi:hypothetical protein BDD12DRAFT_866026 [Trichophaea hybrida]|nr:hypothetical protein BDD12DRAFT_866026 [Trichophaea hybrida]
MSSKPTLLIAADTSTCDISPWATEGYTVHLLTKATQRTIEDAADDLESNDRYAILAFGAAATAALQFATRPSRQLQAVAAYYPLSLPSTAFHPTVHILLHLPHTYPFSLRTSSTVRIRLYDAAPGFAQPTTPTYDRIATSLAFSRTLALLRGTIGPEMPDLEGVWEDHLRYKFHDKSVNKTMDTMVSQPYVNYVPTLTGGRGYNEIHRFYKDFFIPRCPPSMRMTLVSRTVGSDRIRGRLCQESVYFDTSSVLVQVGLLERGTLPVVGKEAARKVLDRNEVESNGLIRDW